MIWSVTVSADGSIDYLDTLISEVQVNIDTGIDVTDTVTAVTMDEFQGYALWDWVHNVINVPATYAELSNNN